ncbi:non-specific serine/threonine protein kinase [Entamoeba marina]
MNIFRRHQPTLTIADHKLIVVKELISRQRNDSRVLQVKDVNTHKNYTIKQITCKTQDETQFILKEIAMNKKFTSCENILTVYGHNIQKEKDGTTTISILREFCQYSLADLISSSDFKPFPEETILRTILGLANAIAVLHHHNPPIIHCDVRTDHVLLNEKDVPRLIDFGASCIGQFYIKNIKEAKQLEKEIHHSTIAYRAPELVMLQIGTLITEKIDVWSLGCILYKMAFFRYPFGESMVCIREGRYKIPKWNKYSNSLTTLLSMMLRVDPDERATIQDIIVTISQRIGIDPKEDKELKKSFIAGDVRKVEEEEKKVKSVHSDLETSGLPEIQLMKKEKRDIVQRLAMMGLDTEEEEELENKKDTLEQEIKFTRLVRRENSLMVSFSDYSPSSGSSTDSEREDD